MESLSSIVSLGQVSMVEKDNSDIRARAVSPARKKDAVKPGLSQVNLPWCCALFIPLRVHMLLSASSVVDSRRPSRR